jgi:hypothetical protein
MIIQILTKMKKIKKIVFVLILLISCISVNSQEKIQTETAVLKQDIIVYKLTATIPQNQTNSSVITQIGNQNFNQNTIITNQSNIQVFQIGQFNSIDIYRNETEVKERIYQNGNHNTVHEMSIGNYNTIENQFIQNGDNNRITSFGSNAISDNLKIQINGNNTSVIVISR